MTEPQEFLNPEEVERFERLLSNDPYNLSTRLQLLAAYRILKNHGGSSRHLSWLVEYKPDLQEWIEPILSCDDLPKESIDDLAGLWLSQIEQHAQNSQVLYNAAAFFRSIGRVRTSISIARRARHVHASTPLFDIFIASTQGNVLNRRSSRQAVPLFTEILECSSSALNKIETTGDYKWATPELLMLRALAAAELGHESVEQFANAIEDQYQRFQMLGLARFNQRKRSEAKLLLLHSANFPPTTEMELARRLLAADEREIVSEFLSRLLKHDLKTWQKTAIEDWLNNLDAEQTLDWE